MENYFELNFDTAEVNAISNLGLAHMGDCVFEILCRAYLCTRGDKTVDKLHRDTINMVKATSQAKFAEKMLPLLTEEEQEFPCPRGAQVRYPRRVRQGHRRGGPVRRIVPAGPEGTDQRDLQNRYGSVKNHPAVT